MALRVLTDDERQDLQGDPTFIEKSQWAVRNYADFWSVNDGSSASTEALKIKWAKDRQLGVSIVLNDINDPAIGLKFVKISKAMEFDLAAAPVAISVIVAAFVAGNKFDEIAGTYFTQLGETINFSVSQS